MRLEIRTACSKSLIATQLNPKTPDLQKKKPERHWKLRSRGKTPNFLALKGIENSDLGAKPQIFWRRWPNHFESTKKVMKLMEQFNVM